MVSDAGCELPRHLGLGLARPGLGRAVAGEKGDRIAVRTEDVIRDVIADFLTMEGFDVRTAADGGFAERELAAGAFDVVLTVAIALTLSLLATWYPARRAARLDPVEALRYE